VISGSSIRQALFIDGVSPPLFGGPHQAEENRSYRRQADKTAAGVWRIFRRQKQNNAAAA
jgi:hypothetical protein